MAINHIILQEFKEFPPDEERLIRPAGAEAADIRRRPLTLIVAVGEDGAIGRSGGLLCHLRADLLHFKALTTGHSVVMGRKTFESLPKGALPNRRNIVVSRAGGLRIPGAEVYPSLDSALEAAYSSDPEPFVIGGGQIYAQAMPRATRLCITRLMASWPDADTFFPAIDPAVWKLDEASETETSADGLRYRFETYTRLP